MIILLVPELEALQTEARSMPSGLTRLTARASERRLDPVGYLCELITGHAVPPAPILRLRDCPTDAVGIWMLATPVRLRPDLNAVWVQRTAFDRLDHPAVEELAALFGESGLGFELPRPDRGYVRLTALPDCTFTPPWQLRGRSLDHSLPEGGEARSWTRLLNECQVLLHQHRSDDHGGPGGLWFWGAGRLPEAPSPRVAHLSGRDEQLPAIADWLQLSYSPEATQPADSTLLVWDAPEDVDADQALARLAEFIRPLWRRLLLGSIDAIELASRTRAWRVEPRQARRFWVRGR
jgi:hypothetical protein